MTGGFVFLLETLTVTPRGGFGQVKPVRGDWSAERDDQGGCRSYRFSGNHGLKWRCRDVKQPGQPPHRPRLDVYGIP